MTIKISRKIKGYSVAKPGADTTALSAGPDPHDAIEVPKAEVIQMHEKVERPEVLIGATYKIR
ncbi:MAG: NrdJb, partial [Xanthomonadaceae bacterium]|nr:NrdJb [Xanthomonadaceae bacterium]